MPVTIDGNNTPTAGGVVYGDGTEYASTSAGTSGQLLRSNGSAAPSWVNAPTTSPAGSTGQVQINNAGAFGAVSSGTSGQVLTSQGTGAAPTWTTPSAGAMVFLESVTASNTAEVDLTAFSSTYDDYIVTFHNAQSSINNSDRLCYRLRVSGTWQTGNSYAFARHRMSPADGNYSQQQSASANTTQITGEMGTTGTYGAAASAAGKVLLLGANTTRLKSGLFETYYRDIGIEQQVSARGHGTWTADSGVLSGIRFFMSGSALATGIFRLYGIAKS